VHEEPQRKKAMPQNPIAHIVRHNFLAEIAFQCFSTSARLSPTGDHWPTEAASDVEHTAALSKNVQRQ
jgi:hypothetical protein